jgi:hypothetical protein
VRVVLPGAEVILADFIIEELAAEFEGIGRGLALVARYLNFSGTIKFELFKEHNN